MFLVAYYGTSLIEGLATPENYYSPFVDHYLDYPSGLRNTLLWGTKFLIGIFGYKSFIADAYHLQMVGGKAVQLIYACLGVGVMSFWLAFVVANKGSWKRKTVWVMGGWACIWLINITRIGLLLVTFNANRKMPFGLDNHTFFDILAYGAIFLLIFFYDRRRV